MKRKYLDALLETDRGKIETAKNLLKQKVDINIIQDVTGLSKEELDKLI